MAQPAASAGDRVAILWWPEDAADVVRLRESGVPRLLLLAPDAAAPATPPPDEDWLRRPASDEDVRARVAGLAARCAEGLSGPSAGGDGRLRYRGSWVALSETESAIARALSERFQEVVDLAELARADGGRRLSENAIRVHVTRLRKRIQPLGLVVRTVRGRGYVLDVS